MARSAPPSTPPTSAIFDAMGTSAHVVVLADRPGDAADLLDMARDSVDDLERCWSRFLPDSDICRINRTPNRPVRVDHRTADLVAKAIDGWEQTGGVFDPTVGRSLRAAGYDRPFIELTTPVAGAVQPAPSPIGVTVHRVASTVTVPAGVELDLGGIGKGAAADLTVRSLLDAGARGAMVNLGGDLRADGQRPIGGWRVVLDCPGGRQQRAIRIAAGAVCTSSTTRRRWATIDDERHHIVEPHTGRPTATDLCTATVVGAEATQCEVLATTAIGLGLVGARRLIESHHACGLLIDDAGNPHEVGPIGDFA